MSRTFNVQTIAERMVSGGVGGVRTFPFDVEAASLRWPVHVLPLEDLSPAKIERWLYRELGWAPSTNADYRKLRGCLVAHRGCAMIFLEASESDNERRFTLAHELAHFIGHYLFVRELAISRLGGSIAGVLDGDRLPTDGERLSGVLARCPLGVFRDALDREGTAALSALAERMEHEADAAAFAALGPPSLVLARCETTGVAPNRASVAAVLTEEFGLAHADAVHHVSAVLRLVRKRVPGLLESLKDAAASNSSAGRSMS